MSGGITRHQARAFEVSDDGSSWHAVPFVGTISKSGGDGTTTQVEAIDGVSQIVNPPGVPTITVNVVGLAPNTTAYRTLISAGDGQETIWYRIRTNDEETIIPTTTTGMAAITTAGVVTISGADAPDFLDDPLINVGNVLTVGGNDYDIDAIASNTELTVSPSPATAVAAAVFSVKIPMLTDTGRARVVSIGNYDLGVGQILSGPIVMAPVARTYPTRA